MFDSCAATSIGLLHVVAVFPVYFLLNRIPLSARLASVVFRLHYTLEWGFWLPEIVVVFWQND